MYKLVFTFSLFLSISSFAGDSKGHGGDILRCLDTASEFNNLPLDLYELTEKYKWKILSYENLSEVEIAEDVIKSFIDYDLHRYIEMKRNLKSFYKDVKWVNFPLVNVRDSGDYSIPEGCELEQIVNQNKKLLRGQKKYLVRKDLWNQLPYLSKAVIIVHELLYLSSETSTSEGIRELTARSFSKQISTLNLDQYIKLLKETSFKAFSFSGANLQLNETLKFHPTGEIKSGTPVEKSLLFLGNNSYPLNFRDITFHTNGSIQSFCSYKGVQITLFDNELKGACANHFGHYAPVTLYNNQNIKEISIIEQFIETPHFKVTLGNLNSSNFYYSSVSLTRDGELHSIKNAQLELKSYEPMINLSSKRPIIFSNNHLKAGFISPMQKLIINKNILWITGETTISDNLISSTKIAISTEITVGVNSVSLSANSTVFLHPNGSIKKVTIYKAHILVSYSGERVFFEKGSSLIFDNKGNLL